MGGLCLFWSFFFFFFFLLLLSLSLSLSLSLFFFFSSRESADFACVAELSWSGKRDWFVYTTLEGIGELMYTCASSSCNAGLVKRV